MTLVDDVNEPMDVDADVESVSSVNDIDNSTEDAGPNVDSGPLRYNEIQNIEQINDDEEIILQVEQDDNLIARCSMLQDFLNRSNTLLDICLWDYISRIEKVCKSKDRLKDPRSATLSEEDESSSVSPDSLSSAADASENDDTVEQPNPKDVVEPSDNGIEFLWDLHLHENTYLKSTSYRRPRINFGPTHPEHTTHYQKVRHHSSRLVPVPLGASLPRCDTDKTKEKHARLMLIFFKPWVVVSELKNSRQSWEDAYKEFVQSAKPRIRKLIDNMQLLHECRDSRDDHFAERNRLHRAETRRQEQARNRGQHQHEKI